MCNSTNLNITEMYLMGSKKKTKQSHKYTDAVFLYDFLFLYLSDIISK